MGIKTVVFIVILAVVGYRVFKLVQFMKYNEAVFNHEPGPCRVVNIAKESCTNLHKDPTTCDDWAERGECKANRDWMKENCAKSCNFCEDLDTPILGSEDVIEIEDGKILMSTGLKYQVDAFPDRKGHIYAFDFNQPWAGGQKVSMMWNNDKIASLNPHGIGMWKNKDGKVFVFVVNHDGDEAVERFEYNVKLNMLIHLETVTHTRFTNLNSVQPTGERTFYATNLQYANKRFMSKLEGYLMLRFGNSVHYDGSDATVVSSGHFLANGIHTSANNKYLYLADGGNIHTYDILEDNTLQLVDTLDLKNAVDNIKVDLKTGDVWAAVVPIPFKMLNHMHDPKNATAPAKVLKIRTQDGMPTNDITEVYANDGGTIQGSTVAMAYNKHVLIGSLYDKTLLCEL